MDRRGHRVDETLPSVRREIDDDLRARRDRSGNRDIEDHFGVGAAAGIGICRPVDPDERNIRNRQLGDILEVVLDVAHLVAAAKLHNADRLTGGGIGWESIELGDLRRQKSGCGLASRYLPIERRNQRTGVKAVYALDDILQAGRHARCAGMTEVARRAGMEPLQFDAKGGVQLRDRSGKDDRAAPRVALDHGQAVLSRERFDAVEIGGRTAILLRVFLPRHVMPAFCWNAGLRTCAGERGGASPGADAQRNRHFRAGIRRADGDRSGNGNANRVLDLASGNCWMRSCSLCHGFPPEITWLCAKCC